MFTTEELKYAAKILNFFAPPPKCVCGSRQFKFGIKNHDVLRAFCLKCGKEYIYDVRSRKWYSTFVSKPLTNLKEAKMEILLEGEGPILRGAE